MKELRNDVDDAVSFDNLEEAKKYYIPEAKFPCEKDEFLGSDFDFYCEQFNEYKTELSKADSLEELASVLNKYTDTFDNGSEYRVVEF